MSNRSAVSVAAVCRGFRGDAPSSSLRAPFLLACCLLALLPGAVTAEAPPAAAPPAAGKALEKIGRAHV